MNILITGTSTGFGKLMVQTLAKNSGEHRIFACMRGVDGKNTASAQELLTLEGVEVLELDVTDQKSIDEAIGQITAQRIVLDVVVNNAGVYGGGMYEAYSIEQIQKIFDINVYGPVRIHKAVLPQMRKAGSGLIINVSSVLGMFATPLSVPYCASKFAVEGFVTGSYGELIQLGIENVLIEPGAFPTELFGKEGVNADEQPTIDSYGDMPAKMQEYAYKTLTGKLEEVKPNPQAIADKVLELVNMPKGSRPVHNVVDPISGEAMNRELESTFASLGKKWAATYGF